MTEETDCVDRVVLRFRGEVGEGDFLEEIQALGRHCLVAGGVSEDNFNN